MEIYLQDRTEQTVEVYFRRAADPVIRAVLPQKAKTLEEALADYRAMLLPGATSYGRTVYADGQYVGDVWCYCMDETDPEGMLSYCIFEPSLWNRGIATRAVGLFLQELRQHFGIHTLGAFAYAANTASIRVLERNGFCLQERFMEDGVESAYYQAELPE